MNYDKIYKWAKGIAYGLLCAFVAVFIILAVAVSSKNKTIRTLKANQIDQTELVIRANARADSLAKLECVTVNTTIVMNNKGLVNVNQTNQISRTVAEYTRGEVLLAIDSMNKANNKE